ncbi:helix-turn-helix domain-containing protein [Symbiopectobacterium purcellii]|uniref:helix-turn-helix domain-containing protein n=1 Tax=Symbiopectobacterium purcellii TaxID=2871826 RepID=UPI003F8269F2
MNWKNSILHLKARAGMQTDKDLYARAKINPSAFAAIKRGTATFKTVEKLCSAWGVKVSEFISWGE